MAKRPPRGRGGPHRNSAPKQAERPAAAGWESRMAASTLLYSVMASGADLETALNQNEAFARLEGPDRGLARAIASSALRCLGRIDGGLAQLIDRPLDQIEPAVLAVLRVGAAQVWVLETPGYAAVSATVEAARRWRPARRGGALVNAVLRRASEQADVYLGLDSTTIWPEWLAAKYRAALGPEGAGALAELQSREPPIDLTLKPEVDAQAFSQEIEAPLLPNGSVRLKAGRALGDLPGYARGDWWVQDAGATIAAKLLGDVAGKTVIDLCSAPGGKAMQLAAAGAHVMAVDISRQRLEILRANAQRTKLEMEVVEADARTWRPTAPADAVLLDAPCSAMGVLRRHPEAAWRREPASFAKYPQTQRALLDAAADMLRPGGVLIYCVCTPFPEEGRELITYALTTSKWSRLPVDPAEIPGFRHALLAEGDVLTAPPVRDPDAAEAAQNAADSIESDVFFLSRLERRED